ncbi:MFS transporter [Streptomyces sp. NPDC127084]|uniref:MFS transporter n=1 Tax=Streptomyces sp. NPDC127084 TaxID=3347133 RepID=UPI0036617629
MNASDAAADCPAPLSHPKLVFASLLLTTAVVNINLTVANATLPEIGREFDASQTELDFVVVGYTLGLAASVLYLSALGDRYGWKIMAILGNTFSVPTSIMAAFAPTVEILIFARILGGIAASISLPTTLALITTFWSGRQRAKIISLWGAVGASMVALSTPLVGILLTAFWWGSAFLLSVPISISALLFAMVFVPSSVNEASGTVDHAGGLLSILCAGSVILAINFASQTGMADVTYTLLSLAIATGSLFIISQRRASFPLLDPLIVKRRIFWTAACLGMIVYGARLGALFIGQQFLQNILEYTAFEAGIILTPMAISSLFIAPYSARLAMNRGCRFTLIFGFFFFLLGFAVMLLWRENSPPFEILLAFTFIGLGVGLAGTPTSCSLAAAVPLSRAGMASSVAAIQSALGGAAMQSILGSVLTVGYGKSFNKLLTGNSSTQEVERAVKNQLTKSFAAATEIEIRYPQYTGKIEQAARDSFRHGADWAYCAGILAILLGFMLAYWAYPVKAEEEYLYGKYGKEDRGGG